MVAIEKYARIIKLTICLAMISGHSSIEIISMSMNRVRIGVLW